MKHYSKLLLFALVAGTFVACADEDIATFQTEKPESMVKYEYLNTYDALKSYVDRSANPNFKLGTGITESDFISKGLVYSLACANYDELTPGNAMKYSSVVRDDGSMDFSTVKKFVDTAKDAGLTIYGHTLCWHAQQNLKYLNGLIADKVIPSDPGSANHLLKIATSEEKTQWYDSSVTCILPGGALVKGNSYTLSFRGKASDPTNKLFLTVGSSTGGATQYLGEVFSFGKDWGNMSYTFAAGSDVVNSFLFGIGNFKGSFYIDDIKLTAVGSEENLLTNGDFEQDNLSIWTKPSWHSQVTYSIETDNAGGSITTNKYVIQSDFEDGIGKWAGWGNNSTRQVVDGKGPDGSKCLEAVNPSTKNPWDVQVAYDFPEALIKGETYFLKYKVKGSVAGSIGALFQKPDGFKGCGDFPSMAITTDWKEVTVQTSVTGDDATRFLFNIGVYAGTLLFDDIAVYREVKGNTIPLTPEEKKEVLTNALENWIKGMLEACDGYVKAWDAVNEPMSDGNTSELKYSTNVSADDAKKNFYWQDYLGKDYARDVVKFARQYGGEGMKLFINDYNLEAAYNSNKKCEGLIKMIEYWESDGVTKIDGIGTQMHVTYSMNPDTQKKNENAVVNMLNLLKATGKLIKISELDMGIADANGTSLKTAVVTFEQQKLMSDYYKFIIKKYFEIIPVAQRYGITHWSPSDSPDTDYSFWRKGEPIGLWDLNYNRKPAYAGYAEGLTGK